MKKLIKCAVAVVMAAVFGLSMISCSNGSSDDIADNKELLLLILAQQRAKYYNGSRSISESDVNQDDTETEQVFLNSVQ